jgi:hypothetical protein
MIRGSPLETPQLLFGYSQVALEAIAFLFESTASKLPSGEQWSTEPCDTLQQLDARKVARFMTAGE